MAANNAYRLREAELSVKRLAVQEAPPPRSNTNQLDSSTSSSRGVHSLVEKIQNGLEVNGSQNLFMFEEQNFHCIFLCLPWCQTQSQKHLFPVLQLQEQVKESHVSEIIDVYAQKISTFAVSFFLWLDLIFLQRIRFLLT